MMNHWTKEDIKKAQEQFWAFVYIVWKSISLPEPTPIQIDIARFLQDPPSDRVIIEGFRGVAKSFLTCAYSVWRLWRERQLKVLIVSASKDRADANARFIKQIIHTVDFLDEMIADKKQLDTQNLFDVGGAIPDISPSVKSVGITGQITGTRADILISDDKLTMSSINPLNSVKLPRGQHRAKPTMGTCNDYSERKYRQVTGSGGQRKLKI